LKTEGIGEKRDSTCSSHKGIMPHAEKTNPWIV